VAIAQPRTPGPAVRDLRVLLATFGTAHPQTLLWASPTAKGRSWLSHDARNTVLAALPGEMKELIVSVSAGKGDPAETPWIAVMRPDITRTPQTGIYVVYLFCPDRQRIVLCIMLGVTRPSAEATLRKAPSTRDSGLLRDLAVKLRKLIPYTPGFDEVTVSIGGSTVRSNQYELGFIYGRTYDVALLPSRQRLTDDLRDILKAYQAIDADDIRAIDVTPEAAQPRDITRGRVRKMSRYSQGVSDLEAALQKRERASAAHERVVQSIVRAVDQAKLPPAQETQHIDVLIDNRYIIEVKSLQRDDPQQMRDGVAQLLYYRFLYRKIVKDAALFLVLGRRPGASLSHFVAFARDCGVIVAWQAGEHFETEDHFDESMKWFLRRATSSH
jgi:MrcB-like, N-terminal domain